MSRINAIIIEEMERPIRNMKPDEAATEAQYRGIALLKALDVIADEIHELTNEIALIVDSISKK